MESVESLTADEERISLKQPVWHLVVLSVSMMPLYWWYWFYKTWRDLKAQAIVQRADSALAGSASSPQPIEVLADINVGWRTFGMLIPLVNIYLAAALTFDIAKIHPDPKSFPRRHPLIATVLVSAASISLLSLVHLQGSAYLLCLSAATPFCFVQHWLNRYFDAVEPGQPIVRGWFNVWEVFVIVLGTAILGLIIAGFMIGVR